MSHFIEICKECNDVISQCRCPSTDKEKRFSICEKCLKTMNGGFPCRCYWCDEKIKSEKDCKELPGDRGRVHKKCADEWYSVKMAEDIAEEQQPKKKKK